MKRKAMYAIAKYTPPGMNSIRGGGITAAGHGICGRFRQRRASVQVGAPIG